MRLVGAPARLVGGVFPALQHHEVGRERHLAVEAEKGAFVVAATPDVGSDSMAGHPLGEGGGQKMRVVVRGVGGGHAADARPAEARGHVWVRAVLGDAVALE